MNNKNSTVQQYLQPPHLPQHHKFLFFLVIMTRLSIFPLSIPTFCPPPSKGKHPRVLLYSSLPQTQTSRCEKSNPIHPGIPSLPDDRSYPSPSPGPTTPGKWHNATEKLLRLAAGWLNSADILLKKSRTITLGASRSVSILISFRG